MYPVPGGALTGESNKSSVERIVIKLNCAPAQM